MAEDKPKATKKKGGRPKIEIDKATFEKLCGLQCTMNDIAGFFNCSHDTIERWVRRNYSRKTFGEVFEEKRSHGLISLRRNQFRQSETNATMAIWLGKQYLGQKDIITFSNHDESEADPLTQSIEQTIEEDTKKKGSK